MEDAGFWYNPSVSFADSSPLHGGAKEYAPHRFNPSFLSFRGNVSDEKSFKGTPFGGYRTFRMLGVRYDGFAVTSLGGFLTCGSK